MPPHSLPGVSQPDLACMSGHDRTSQRLARVQRGSALQQLCDSGASLSRPLWNGACASGKHQSNHSDVSQHTRWYLLVSPTRMRCSRAAMLCCQSDWEVGAGAEDPPLCKGNIPPVPRTEGGCKGSSSTMTCEIMACCSLMNAAQPMKRAPPMASSIPSSSQTRLSDSIACVRKHTTVRLAFAQDCALCEQYRLRIF